MIFVLSFIAISVFYVAIRCHRASAIKNKEILIIGGSSGLGLAFAKILKKEGNRVTITSRSIGRLRPLEKAWGFSVEALDVGNFGTGMGQTTNYDYVFCCAGLSIPSYFVDQPSEIFEQTIRTNYLGTVNALKYYSSVNRRPFGFIMIGSTLSLFTFPGFSSYAPSKSALLSLFYTVYNEMEKLGISLHFYNTAAILTPGYRKEQETKPSYTRCIEEALRPASAEERAGVFLRNMMGRRVVASDMLTYLYQIKVDCECLTDYILFPLAVATVFISKAYAKWKFRAA